MTSTAPRRRAVLACLLVAYALLGVFHAWVLADQDYEAQYLGLGRLLVRGEISLYQDEMTGQWMPLPFWLYGLSQTALGPGLLLPRLISVALGAGAVLLAFALAARWAGLLAGAVAGGLLCTYGLMMGYFATVHFGPVTALLHLAAIWVLFVSSGPRRDLVAMAIVSVLFLVKPNYWPTIPFVLAYLLWRAGSGRRRVALVATALALPVAFFAWPPDHLKILAFVPVLSRVVEPLGWTPWFPLVEDAADFWRSDYITLTAGGGWGARLASYVATLGLIVKRYAVWLAVCAGLAALAAWTRRGSRERAAPWPPGVAFTLTLFLYLVLTQFAVVGPFVKQAFGYVGSVAPLLVVVIATAFGRVWTRAEGLSGVRAVMAAGIVLAVAASPWVHRDPNLPRRISMADATVPALSRAAARLAAVIPPGEHRVFLLGDPLIVHLADRRSYLRQFHQWWIVFTSSREPERYRRTGLWGLAELEQWLGSDARYAIVQTRMLAFYRGRKPYREALERMDGLLERNFTLRETIALPYGDRLLVYRRDGA